MLPSLTKEQFSKLSDSEQSEYIEHMEALYRERGRKRFRDFARMVEVPGAPRANEKISDFRRELARQRGEILPDDEPDVDEFYPKLLQPARHHDLIMDTLQDLIEERLCAVDGEYADGAMFFAPPGSSKSTYTSMLAPAYFMGKYPNFNVIGASYAQSVANRFSRRARHIAGSKEFGEIFEARLTGDNKAVENWMMTNGSEYRATGVQAAVTSFRADFLGIDDPVAGREEADSEIIQEKTNSSYHDDLCSRLKPGGKIGMIMTRWNLLDLGGHILGADWKGESGFWKGTDGRLWYIVNLPLLAEHPDDPLGRRPGELLWPEWFRLRDAQRLKENAEAKGGSHARTWNSLYQQRPALAEGAIIKRAYWKKWPKAEPPKVTFVGLFYDTAFEEDELTDPSAMTAWGVFEHTSRKGTGEEYNHQHLIMLGAWEEHVEAVDLPDIIAGNRQDNPHPDERIVGHAEIFKPDVIAVEKRASGAMVVQALRKRRLPVKAWLPEGKPGSKGKTPRAWATALAMESGGVWYMDGPMTQKVIEQCSQYSGEGTAPDHLLDTVTMAVLWFRKRGMHQTADEEMDAEEHRQWLLEKKQTTRKRKIYGDTTRHIKVEDDDHTWARFTPETRRKLYG